MRGAKKSTSSVVNLPKGSGFGPSSYPSTREQRAKGKLKSTSHRDAKFTVTRKKKTVLTCRTKAHDAAKQWPVSTPASRGGSKKYGDVDPIAPGPQHNACARMLFSWPKSYTHVKCICGWYTGSRSTIYWHLLVDLQW